MENYYHTKETRVATLRSGALAWREFGDPNGRPLFFLHGWPGSSAQCWLVDAAAQRHGFRGFAIDRPGIGVSPRCERCLLDWPEHIRQFAESQGIERFAVVGVSGGGPYALACAWGIPEMLLGTAVVCGAPPIAELNRLGGLHPVYRSLLGLFHRRPEWVRWFFRKLRPFMFWADACAFTPPLRILLPRPDAEVLQDPGYFEGVFGCQREAFVDVDGVFADATIYAKPWGFRPEEIRLPVAFWHGRDDANFHYSMAEELAARIPGATLRIVEHEGHYSLPINQADAIVAALASSC
jgi:pimeloyl-ACP methyl ester carboxylesterase